MKPLYGLVVCGGQSTRMGIDKSLLKYFSEPQRYHLYHLMEAFCEKVFLSCNTQQLSAVPTKYNVIEDAGMYNSIGPMGAILSAFEKHPEAAFMVIGCDYPFIRKDDLQLLINARNMTPLAVSYYNEENNFPEPLLAIYEPEIHGILNKNFIKDEYSLRLLLEEIDAYQLYPYSPEVTISVDTPAEYSAAVDWIKEIGIKS